MTIPGGFLAPLFRCVPTLNSVGTNDPVVRASPASLWREGPFSSRKGARMRRREGFRLTPSFRGRTVLSLMPRQALLLLLQKKQNRPRGHPLEPRIRQSPCGLSQQLSHAPIAPHTRSASPFGGHSLANLTSPASRHGEMLAQWRMGCAGCCPLFALEKLCANLTSLRS